jgi:S1-C subfamily serine protease
MTKIKKIISVLFIILSATVFIGCHTTMNPDYLYIHVNQTIRLQTSLTGELNWSSDNENVAIVDDDGVVTGINIGLATITAQTGKQVSKVIISVEAEKPEVDLLLSGKQNLLVNESTTLVATLTNTTTNSPIYWETSNEEVATIDSNGVVYGVSPGLVTITASTYQEKTLTKQWIILVSNVEGDSEIVNNEIENRTYEVVGEIDLTTINNTITTIVNNVMPSIVGVSNYQYRNSAPGFPSILQLESVGTGFIINREKINDTEYRYYVLTNYHVVQDRIELRIFFGDHEDEIRAEYPVQANAKADLAVITFVSGKELNPLTFAATDSTNAGDFVIAIGNPTGYDFFRSVTFGMISCPERNLAGETSLFVQHDAAINPGNSGGPLFDLDGHVIGVNTIKIIDTDVENIGFAIALKTINEFISGLANYPKN